MLTRRFRLKQRSLFAKTMSSGMVLCSTPFFLVLGLKRLYESDTPSRFGFIVSKKVSNRAVVRNKIRRRLQELVRTEILTRYYDKIGPFVSVVIIARQGSLSATYGQLQQSFTHCLEKTGRQSVEQMP